MPMYYRVCVALVGWGAVWGAAAPVLASQAEPSRCHALCAPKFNVLPLASASHAFDHPRVRDLTTGEVTRLQSQTNLAVQLSVIVPTQLQPLSLFVTATWLPTANARVNPFTEYTASALGEPIRANLPAVTAGVGYQLLSQAHTNGWLDLTPYIGVQFSPAAQPDAASDYTYKWDLGTTATVGPFATEDATSWFQHVRLWATLDWVASGLPQAGDEVPKGERVFVDDVRGVSFLIGLQLPVAPLP